MVRIFFWDMKEIIISSGNKIEMNILRNDFCYLALDWSELKKIVKYI